MTGFNRPNQNCNRMEAKQDEDGNSCKGASPSTSRSRSNGSTSPWDEESMVGFEEEARMIKEQLAGGPKQLEVISIVGMAGLGKTTLATNLYRDPFIEYHFHIRAWISVSQVYSKRDLLITMVTSVVPHISGIDQMSIDKLSDKLYKGLKGRRYLIVVDDVWESSAWDDLRFHFPKDTNGSRIMLTSRHAEVASHAKRSYPPLSLRFLNEDESWDLFKKKVFRRETFPPELMEIGKNIVAKCQGLPLAIVVVAGVLANEEKNRDRWRQVGKAMNSPMVANQELWMKTLTLSYSHLPNHLKLCFLYFGAFPEDFQVPVWKLIWLWIAEGFVQKTEGKCLEDVAEGYLLDLIGRSLILVSTRRYDGEIKACGIHDLLREFCLKKAEEDYFLLRISCNQHLSSRSSKLFSRMRLLSIYGSVNLWDVISKITSAASTSSVLCFGPRGTPWNSEMFPPTFSPKWFNLLGVLDMSSAGFTRYPTEIEQFVRLKYLSLCIYSLNSETYLPQSISNLSNLETLIVCTLTLLPCAVQLMNLSLTRQELHKFLGKSSSVTLPHCVRNMVKLRHIRLTGHGIHRIERQDYLPFLLDNLQTLSWVNPTSCQAFLVGTPNIRKLGFRGPLISGGCLSFPHLDNLTNLQELKLFNTGSKEIVWLSYNLGRVKFPPNLKKLTLKETYLKWEEMSTLGNLLPNLESLKLLAHACTGEHWETSDGDFPQLKFLKLESLGIVRWEFSSSHFPRLQRLEVSHCYWLEKIQSEIGDIPTLQMMTVHWCNLSLADSAREIKEEQESIGNKWLRFTESNNIATPEMLEGQGQGHVASSGGRISPLSTLSSLQQWEQYMKGQS